MHSSCYVSLALRPLAVAVAFVAATGLAVPGSSRAADPYVDRVRSFVPGQGAGFGQASMPAIVLGAPEGTGALEGALDVVSLGEGGSIILAFRNNLVFDGPGDDLVIFENAFHSGSVQGPVFEELAFVEASADGKHFVAWPWDLESGQGMAGRQPVYANSSNSIDPLSPEGGGDRFDLADIGLAFARYVRITDAGSLADDPGNHLPSGDKGGFDLDAVAAINSSKPAKVVGIVTRGGQPVAGARVKLFSTQHKRGRRQWRRSRANGRFRFRPLAPLGTFIVKVRKPGLGKAQQVAYVDSDSLVDRLYFIFN